MPNTPAEKRVRLRRWPALVAVAILGAAVLIPASPAAAVDNASISGTISFFPGLAPVEGSTVTLFDQFHATVGSPSFTDSNGDYSFTGLPAGDYKVCARNGHNATPAHADVCWDYRPFWPMSNTFALAESEAKTVDIDVVNGATLSGTVTGEDGPSDNWNFNLDGYYDDGFGTYLYGSSEYHQISSVDGTWSLEHVQPGRYQIRYFDNGTDPDYRHQYHNQTTVAGDAEFIVVTNNANLTIDASMSFVGPLGVSRLSGANRYETAVEVSKQFSPINGVPANPVYIAAGTNYPDALAAAAVAGWAGAPLLLTPADSLPAAVIEELERLKPAVINIAGGEAVVSPAVEAQLTALDFGFPHVVNRLGGADRYATAKLLVDNGFSGGFTTAFIATGRNFADALAAAATATSRNAPVILVDGTLPQLSTAQLDWLDTSGVESVFIAGGTSAVSAGIEASLVNRFGPAPGSLGDPGVTRLGGADRYATSVLINDVSLANYGKVYLATGVGFADALSGAALAGAVNAALFTVPGTCIPSDVLDAFGDLGISEVVLLGGAGVLSEAVYDLTEC